MSLLPCCRETSELLTDYMEGKLPARKALAVRLHLGICPPCLAFADSLRALPGLLRRALGREDQPALDAAHRALEHALARASEPRQPRTGPCCELPPSVRSVVDAGQADPPLQAMVEVHRILLEDGPVADPPHLPPATLKAFPPMASWRWSWGFGGMRFARLLHEGTSTLFLVRLSPETSAPAHRHRGVEQTLMLQGGLEDGSGHFGPGAWIVQAPGSSHAPHATARGCWALVRVEHGVDLSGWRGWLQRMGAYRS